MMLYGTEIAARVEHELATRVAALPFQPRLIIILVGNDPASVLYDERKQMAAQRVGIACELIHVNTTTTEELTALINGFNERADVDGILVQLPLPDGINASRVISEIDPSKDVDGFHPQSIEALAHNDVELPPALIQALLWLIDETHESFAGRHAVIVGKSDVFLEPLSSVLTRRGLGVTWVRPHELPSKETSRADLLIVAAGSLFCIGPSDVKSGATIIDIGINKLPDGKVRGDVHPDCAGRAAFMTPTPGGVGPVTIAAALHRLVELALRRRV